VNDLISQVPFTRINTQLSAPPSAMPLGEAADRLMKPVVRAVAVALIASALSGLNVTWISTCRSKENAGSCLYRWRIWPNPRQVCGRPRDVHAVSLTKAFPAYRRMTSAGLRARAAAASFVIRTVTTLA
jgi:hypothetical protein